MAGAGEGHGRGRGQGHEGGGRRRVLRRRAGRGPPRGAGLLRRRPRAPRAIPGPAAPRRGPGVRGHPGERRAPLRARLLDPASSPEGARGGARTRARSGHAGGDGARRRRRRPRHRVRGRRDGGVPPRRGRPLLLHGDEHPPPGRAPGHRDDHRAGPGRVAAPRRGRGAPSPAAGGARHHRARHRGARLRGGPLPRLPAVHRRAGPPPAAPRVGARPGGHRRPPGRRGHHPLRPDDRQAGGLGHEPRRARSAGCAPRSPSTRWSA